MLDIFGHNIANAFFDIAIRMYEDSVCARTLKINDPLVLQALENRYFAEKYGILVEVWRKRLLHNLDCDLFHSLNLFAKEHLRGEAFPKERNYVVSAIEGSIPA